MVESIIKDKKRVIPCAAYLTGSHAKHYGADGIYIGLPIKIGENGVEQIYDMDFNPDEKALWVKTVESVESSCQKVDDFLKTSN